MTVKYPMTSGMTIAGREESLLCCSLIFLRATEIPGIFLSVILHHNTCLQSAMFVICKILLAMNLLVICVDCWHHCLSVSIYQVHRWIKIDVHLSAAGCKHMTIVEDQQHLSVSHKAQTKHLGKYISEYLKAS